MKKTIWMGVLALLVVTVLAAGACQAEQPPNGQPPPNPVTSTWGLGDKQVVTISGDSTGHVAGGQSEFRLILDNRSADEHWQGEYCILLLDRDGVVLEIAHEQFSIPPGLAPLTTITVEFPAGLSGPYGLSFLMPERGQSIQTIWIGDMEPVSAGPWPMFTTCP